MIPEIRKTGNLREKYPPSEPCSCEVCVSYCRRPRWWSVEEAEKAIAAGYAHRMMLEVSPEKDFGVLSPAFKGNECNFSLQIFAKNGCSFLKKGLCELYGTGIEPLECRFCHHDRTGLGKKCHLDIENEWKTAEAKRLVVRWGNLTSFWKRQDLVVVEK